MRKKIVSDLKNRLYDTSSFYAVLRRRELAVIDFAHHAKNQGEVTITVRREDGEHQLVGIVVEHVPSTGKKRMGELAIIKPKDGSYLSHWNEVPIWRFLPNGPVGILKKRGVLVSTHPLKPTKQHAA